MWLIPGFNMFIGLPTQRQPNKCVGVWNKIGSTCVLKNIHVAGSISVVRAGERVYSRHQLAVCDFSVCFSVVIQSQLMHYLHFKTQSLHHLKPIKC